MATSPHVKGRLQAAKELKRHPGKHARRWIVEVAHGWFNRFRKLLARYENLERSFVALNHLAANITYGDKFLSTPPIICAFVLPG